MSYFNVTFLTRVPLSSTLPLATSRRRKIFLRTSIKLPKYKFQTNVQNPLGKCVIFGRMSNVAGEVMDYRMCGKTESRDEWEEMLSSFMLAI